MYIWIGAPCLVGLTILFLLFRSYIVALVRYSYLLFCYATLYRVALTYLHCRLALCRLSFRLACFKLRACFYVTCAYYCLRLVCTYWQILGFFGCYHVLKLGLLHLKRARTEGRQ